MSDRRSSRRAGEPAGHLVVDAVLVAVVAISVVAALSTLVVHRVVLDETTYTAALVEADAYERLYTEVLPDPAMVAVQDDLLGGLRLPPELATQARTLTTNVLRWTVPPSTVQAGVETVVTGALSYVRGDTPQLEVDIDLVGVAERVEEAARTQVRALLAGVRTQVVADLEAYRSSVAAIVADLEDGVLPSVLPELPAGSVPDGVVADAILDALGDRVDARMEEVVAAAVAAGTQVDALIVAVSEAVVEHADPATERWADGDGAVVDLAERIESRVEGRAGAVVDSLDAVRGVATIFRPATAAVATLVASSPARRRSCSCSQAEPGPTLGLVMTWAGILCASSLVLTGAILIRHVRFLSKERSGSGGADFARNPSWRGGYIAGSTRLGGPWAEMAINREFVSFKGPGLRRDVDRSQVTAVRTQRRLRQVELIFTSVAHGDISFFPMGGDEAVDAVLRRLEWPLAPPERS